MIRVYEGNGVPPLAEPQCSLIQAEVRTGKVLGLDGRRRDARSNTPYILIFDSREEAEQFAHAKVAESPEVECHIYDHRGQHLSRIISEDDDRAMTKPESRWRKFFRLRFH